MFGRFFRTTELDVCGAHAHSAHRAHSAHITGLLGQSPVEGAACATPEANAEQIDVAAIGLTKASICNIEVGQRTSSFSMSSCPSVLTCSQSQQVTELCSQARATTAPLGRRTIIPPLSFNNPKVVESFKKRKPPGSERRDSRRGANTLTRFQSASPKRQILLERIQQPAAKCEAAEKAKKIWRKLQRWCLFRRW